VNVVAATTVPPLSLDMLLMARNEISVVFKDLFLLAGHENSAASSAFSLGLPPPLRHLIAALQQSGLYSAPAAVFTHPYGFFGLCKCGIDCTGGEDGDVKSTGDGERELPAQG